ncbi:hepcidin-2-like [Pelodytes ibericus]
MKLFVFCVLLLLSTLFNRSHSASLKENEIMNSADTVAQPQMEESNILEPLRRTKRQSNLSICMYCCNCCKKSKKKGCGFCCLT